MTSDRYTDHAEVARNVSATAHLLEELALYAHRPYDEEADRARFPSPPSCRAHSPTCSMRS